MIHLFRKKMKVISAFILIGILLIPHGEVAAGDMDITRLHTAKAELGNQVVDYYKKTMKTDLAMESAENIENADLVNEKNKIVVKKMSGIEIIITLERSLDQLIANEKRISENQAEDSDGGRILYVGGTVIHYLSNKEAGNRIKEIQIGKEKIDNEKEYLVATSEKLAKNKSYPDIRVGKTVQTDHKLTLQEAIKKSGEIQATKEQKDSRYIGSQKKEEKKDFNMVVFIGTGIIAVLIGVLLGWKVGRDKRKNQL